MHGPGEVVRSTVRWGLGQAVPYAAIARAARVGDLHGRLVVEGRHGDDLPLELYERIRSSGPMHRARYAFVTVSHSVVKEVLTGGDFQSAIDFGTDGPVRRLHGWADATAPLGPLAPPSLLVTEPPDHTRYRRLVTHVFSARAVADLRRRTEEVAEELLGSMARRASGAEPVDLAAEYCRLLPVTVIADILGVPRSERRRVLEFGEAAAPSLDLGLSWSEFRRVERALASFDEWLVHHLDDVRRHPGDNLISRLVAARGPDGRGLTNEELRSTAGLVLAAGFETTVNLLGNGTVALRRHPDQLERLRRQPDLWPGAVDEVLRTDPPVLLTGRMAVRDTTVAGMAAPRRTVVTTVLAAANRDPTVFGDPHRFDVTRPNAKEHLSFSAGRHFCVGAALARMEGEVGLRMLFERFPDLELLPGARRRPTRILRGYSRLPARLR
jgi:hypothetical protein